MKRNAENQIRVRKGSQNYLEPDFLIIRSHKLLSGQFEEMSLIFIYKQALKHLYHTLRKCDIKFTLICCI